MGERMHFGFALVAPRIHTNLGGRMRTGATSRSDTRRCRPATNTVQPRADAGKPVSTIDDELRSSAVQKLGDDWRGSASNVQTCHGRLAPAPGAAEGRRSRIWTRTQMALLAGFRALDGMTERPIE